MDELEKERRLRAKYPPHIVLLVKAAKKALDEKRATIQDGMLVFNDDLPTADKKPPLEHSVSK